MSINQTVNEIKQEFSNDAIDYKKINQLLDKILGNLSEKDNLKYFVDDNCVSKKELILEDDSDCDDSDAGIDIDVNKSYYEYYTSDDEDYKDETEKKIINQILCKLKTVFHLIEVTGCHYEDVWESSFYMQNENLIINDDWEGFRKKYEPGRRTRYYHVLGTKNPEDIKVKNYIKGLGNNDYINFKMKVRNLFEKAREKYVSNGGA